MVERMDARINVMVPGEVKRRVEALADKQRRRPADVMRSALVAYLRKEESR